MPSALRIRGLTKRYGQVEAVRDLSLEVAAGEIYGLIGPNGAGKTTTLECILGLVAPDAGEIAVEGIDARARPTPAKEKLGALLQSSSLPDAMTPREALRLCAAFYSNPAEPEELIERFRLGEKAGERYATLSGGQRQRLALALAFVSRPGIVVLDEPTVGLDLPARKDLHELIAAERAAGRAILFTTHYLEEARTLCDRVALLDRGRIVAEDAPEALIAQSGAHPRITAASQPPLPESALRALPGVVSVSGEQGKWTLETTALNRTLTALAASTDAAGAELIDLQIHRPTLDDAFLRLISVR